MRRELEEAAREGTPNSGGGGGGGSQRSASPAPSMGRTGVSPPGGGGGGGWGDGGGSCARGSQSSLNDVRMDVDCAASALGMAAGVFYSEALPSTVNMKFVSISGCSPGQSG